MSSKISKKEYVERSVLSKEELEHIFEKAFCRNLVAVLLSTDVANLSLQPGSAAILRGDLKNGAIYALLRSSSVKANVKRLQRVQKNRFQGSASFHDLALAYCIFEIQWRTLDQSKSLRRSNFTTTSMAMGRTIRPLRHLFRSIVRDESIKVLPALLEPKEIEKRFPEQVQELNLQIAKAIEITSRSQNLQCLGFTMNRLLAAFTILDFHGLDSFCADDFLA